MLSIHSEIKNILTHFVEIKKIPNIIFYGPQGSGKKELVRFFLQQIYPDGGEKNKLVLYANCGNNTGIKFIREELKFFSKSNINNHEGRNFKSIILLNADKLTNDAQSALRRCIETNSHNTRFFIVVQNLETLLKPILSRFCCIYVNIPTIVKENSNKKMIDLYSYHIEECFSKPKYNSSYIDKEIKKYNPLTTKACIFLAKTFYNKGIHYKDIFTYLETCKEISQKHKFKTLSYFDTLRLEFRNEPLFFFNILYFALMRHDEELENILII